MPLPVCLRHPKPWPLLPKAEKMWENSSSECALSFIGFSATQRGWLRRPQVGRELSFSFQVAESSGSLRHGLSFRLQVRESSRGLRPDSSQLGREGGGEKSRSGPLIVLRARIVSPFATSASSVWAPKSLQISLRHIHHTKDQVTTRSEPLRRWVGSSPNSGAAPPPATPQAGKADRVGGAGNSPVCCGAAGRGRRRECRPGRPWR